MADISYDVLKKRVFLDRNFDLGKYSEEYVKRRVNSRMFVLKIEKDNFSIYADFLKKNPEEYPKLFDAFSINVTEFFRDVPLWKLLRQKYFPELIELKKNSQAPCVRVWSAGCSTGEEPYSIAMLFNDILPGNFTFSITATDIDRDALEKASKGVYDEAQLKNAGQVNPFYLKKHFTAEPDEKHPDCKKFRVSDGLKRNIIFRHNNFTADDPPRMMDIVFCRNAMIYIAREAKESIFRKVHDSLVEGGLFIIGKSEILPVTRENNSFKLECQLEHIYRKA
ncbi:MAG: hypothetical protein A2297_04070 [Elusimicrobia bacterium RIFOXYB2_FULL_48_7]|nr:MAG: hypothetical protein A2297_04070 [Elusimicrobia bacterium RIFOXYB2_FULL_48_7]